MKPRLIRFVQLGALMILMVFHTEAQEGFNDRTRALYILDISRYVAFDSTFQDKPEFIISVLDRDDKLYWELQRMAQNRRFIQGKPIRVQLFMRAGQLKASSVVFLNHEDGFAIREVLSRIRGTNTLLITEGYPFRSSMINFVVVDGKPRFEANEELMNEEGLRVNQLFLSQAVKTLEDWEALYEVTEGELEMEKRITEQQYAMIEDQQKRILSQEERIRKNEAILEALREEVRQREIQISRQTEVLEQQQREIERQKALIASQVHEVKSQKEVLAAMEREIREAADGIREREAQIAQQEETIGEQGKRIILQSEAIQKQRIIIAAVVLALVLAAGLVYLIWINYRNKKRSNMLLKAQRDQIAYQKKHITDSIEYAEKIQRALLPSLEFFTDTLEHFVLFKPRDIVSGDFYWVELIGDDWVIVAADCTGHGVPGAFMSMLGISFLNEIVLNKRTTRPDEVLNALRTKVVKALKQEAGSLVRDGMDMTVCRFNPKQGILSFSGANNPLYLIRDGNLQQIKGDKMPVAIHETMEPFTLHEMKVNPGDSFYTFSDGFADQFGGERQKKFLARNFRKLLLSLQEHEMAQQGMALDQAFEEYRGDLEQIDDVVVIGIRV